MTTNETNAGDVVESVEVAAPAETAEPTEAAKPAAEAEATPAAETVDAGPLAPRFAALARKEKDLTQREKKLKEEVERERAEVAALKKAAEERAAQAGNVEDLLKLAKERPTEFFAKTGLTYKDLTDAVLKEGEAPTADDRVAKLEARLEKEAAERAEAQKKADEAAAKTQAAEHEKAIADHKAAIAEFVKSSEGKYELVEAEGAHDLVFDLQEAHYRQTLAAGKAEILPVERAAELVEEHLFEEAQRKYKMSKKLAGLFAPASPPAATAPPAADVPPIPKPAAKSPTITSKATASGAAPAAAKKPLLSPREIAAQYQKKAPRNARA